MNPPDTRWPWGVDAQQVREMAEALARNIPSFPARYVMTGRVAERVESRAWEGDVGLFVLSSPFGSRAFVWENTKEGNSAREYRTLVSSDDRTPADAIRSLLRSQVAIESRTRPL